MSLYRLALINDAMEQIESGALTPVIGKLLALDFSENSLEEINARLLTGADQLISFAAQANRISKVEDRAFADMKSLCYVDLSFNRLSTLPRNLLSGSFTRAPGSAVPRILYVCGKGDNEKYQIMRIIMGIT